MVCYLCSVLVVILQFYRMSPMGKIGESIQGISLCCFLQLHANLGFPSGASGKEPTMQETQETWVRSLGQEDLLEEGLATYSSYSCLENTMDRGAGWATVHRVAKSQT